MSPFAGTLETAYENYEATGQKLLEVVRSSEAAAGLEQLVATTVAHEAAAGTLTVETLRRYLSAAEEDREAAAERAAEAAVRSRRLLVAIVCLGVVIGATNVALAVRRPNVFQTYNVAPARAAETPAAAVVQAPPAPPPRAEAASPEASPLASGMASVPSGVPSASSAAKKDEGAALLRPRLIPTTVTTSPRLPRARALALPKDDAKDDGRGDSAAERIVAERW
jgi:hypothetical protein